MKNKREALNNKLGPHVLVLRPIMYKCTYKLYNTVFHVSYYTEYYISYYV